MVHVLTLVLLAASAAAASADPASTLVSTTPWWERMTVTMSADGQPQGCAYESNVSQASQKCEFDSSEAMAQVKGSRPSGVLTKVSFERRFTPGERPDLGTIKAGDTLLGGQVMSLAIDSNGAVRGCQVVAVSGEIPDYGCQEARAERFEAKAARDQDSGRKGYITVLVYGHTEQVV